MNASQRLVANTLATYLRSLLTAILMVFSSRWVLNSLGASDFGLYGVIGSMIVFVTVINSIMSSSAARHFAYNLGEGKDEVYKWFSTALFIHISLATILVIVGYFGGNYLINNRLMIPSDRLGTCRLVFNVSIFSSFVTMISIPFVAMFSAQQKMVEVAVWGIVQASLSFILAFSLVYIRADKLWFYSVGMSLIICFIQIAQMFRAFCLFRECRVVVSECFDKVRLKELFSFAGWNMFGGLGLTIKDQGAAVLINMNYGAGVNAAYNISSQISSAANMLANALNGAVAPEITQTEARQNRERMLELSMSASKFGTILVSIVAIPLIVKADAILKLWLTNPPLYSSGLCKLVLAALLVDRMTTGFVHAIIAKGEIAKFQVTQGSALLLALPIGWLLIRMGYNPYCVGWSFFITMILCSFARIYWARELLSVSPVIWTKLVFLPSAAVFALSATGVVILSYVLDDTFLGILTNFLLSSTFTIIGMWFWVLNDREKRFVCNISTDIKNRFKHDYQR